MPRNSTGNLHKNKRGRHFIREWRKHRGLTQEPLAERIGITKAQLSRIENGKQGYNQGTLEALANALQTDAASLIMRDPLSPEAIWTIWDQAKPAQRRQIEEVAKALLKTGTGP